MPGKNGGARPGSGRKKVAEKTKKETAVELARKKVVDKLPQVVDALIKSALEGDTKAGIHLLDRGLGKVAQAVEHTGQGGGPVNVVHFFLPENGRDAHAGDPAPGGAPDGLPGQLG